MRLQNELPVVAFKGLVLCFCSAVKGKTPQVGDRVLVEAVYNPNMPFKWNAQRIQTLPQLPNQTVSGATWSEQIIHLTVWYGSASTVCHDDDDADAAVDSCVLNLHVAPAASALTSGFPTAVQLLHWRRNATLLWYTLGGGFKTKCNPRHLTPLRLILSFCFLSSAWLLLHSPVSHNVSLGFFPFAQDKSLLLLFHSSLYYSSRLARLISNSYFFFS